MLPSSNKSFKYLIKNVNFWCFVYICCLKFVFVLGETCNQDTCCHRRLHSIVLRSGNGISNLSFDTVKGSISKSCYVPVVVIISLIIISLFKS